jgi:hypothetical protein
MKQTRGKIVNSPEIEIAGRRPFRLPDRASIAAGGSIATLVWIVQPIVTWCVYRDLGPGGSRFIAQSLGLDSNFWIWSWLISVALLSLFVNSRVAANAFAAFTGRRPSDDWLVYSQSHSSAACYWCGLVSFGICLLALPRALQTFAFPGTRTAGMFVLTLLVDILLIRIVAHALFRHRYGPKAVCLQRPVKRP